MNRKLKTLLLVLGLPALALAQTAATSTTLSTAISAPGPNPPSTTIVVASASGISAPSPSTGTQGSILVVDREAMRVLAITGTALLVSRGTDGTAAVGHKSGAIVWFGNPGQVAGSNPDPTVLFDPSGSCTAGNTVAPTISLSSGTKFSCAGGVWAAFAVFAQRLVVSTAIASASTVAPVGALTHITGTTAIVNITLPPACPDTGCAVTFIFDGVDTWTAAGNIAVAGTNTTAASAVTFFYDPVTAKWYPSRLA